MSTLCFPLLKKEKNIEAPMHSLKCEISVLKTHTTYFLSQTMVNFWPCDANVNRIGQISSCTIVSKGVI